MELEKYKKGTIIELKKAKAKIVTDLMKFKDYYAIYADIIEEGNFKLPCGVKKIDNKVALIIRNKRKLLDMGLTTEERKAIYCHELGHCFSSNQSKNNFRNIEDEIDSDTFAIQKCDISPDTMESALKKSYEYEIKNISSKTDLTQARLERYVEEMRARKRNVEKLRKELEDMQL